MIYGIRKLGKARVFPVVPSARSTYNSDVAFLFAVEPPLVVAYRDEETEERGEEDNASHLNHHSVHDLHLFILDFRFIHARCISSLHESPKTVHTTILNSMACPDDVVGSGGIITILSPTRRLFQDPAASLAPPKADVAGTDLFGFH